MPITHAKVSVKSDGSDTSLILPSDWNAEHVGGLSVLGPFSLAWDSTGLASTGFIVPVTLGVGSVVLNAWVALGTPWNVAFSRVVFYVETADHLVASQPLSDVDVAYDPELDGHMSQPFFTSPPIPVVVLEAGCLLVCRDNAAAEGATAGDGDIYALIVEP